MKHSRNELRRPRIVPGWPTRSRVWGRAFLISFLTSWAGSAAGSEPRPDWKESIDSIEAFHDFATPMPRTVLWDEQVNFVFPLEDDPDLPDIAFINGKRFMIHPDFLRAALPQRYAHATGDEILADLFGPQRKFFSGSVVHAETIALWGFLIETQGNEPALAKDLVERIHRVVSVHFTVAPVAYCPLQRQDAEEARTWGDTPFTISYFITDSMPPEVRYTPYVTGLCYGRVRVLEGDDPNGLTREAFGWQDILVLRKAPWDIEAVVAGAVSGEPLPPLSHFALRLAVRGTPNAFLRDAPEAFRSHDGELVRLEIGSADWRIEPVDDPQEAVAWWEARRPAVSGIPQPDADALEVLSLEEIAGLGSEAVRRFGAKAANLAILRRILGPELVVPGFAIPMGAYFRFIDENARRFVAGGVLRSGSYRDFLEAMLEEPAFVTDILHRRGVLEAFQKQARKDGVVDEEVIRAIREEIAGLFGVQTMVRFRSSSNAEDALEFSGAGLYDSTSVCALDEFDPDDAGPSLCDLREEEERTIERGLKRVWTSLWNPRAYEEREYCRIAHLSTGMGILVTPAFPDEAANGVATTGNPANMADRRYMVAVQVGDASVVRPDPGFRPEVDLLSIQGGKVAGIQRGNASSLVPAGQYVLSEAQLRELGAALARIDGEFPVDAMGYAREQILLDVEFKFTREGKLVFKQVRPLLVAGARRPVPPERLAIRVPNGAQLCGHYVAGRSIAEERRLLSRLALRSGVWDLPLQAGTWPFDWVEGLELTDPGLGAEQTGPGMVDVEIHALSDGVFDYRYRFRKSFRAGGEPLEIRSQEFAFRVESGVPDAAEIEVDEDYVTNRRPFDAQIGGATPRVVRYGSCGCGPLPLYEISSEFDRGRAVLHVRQRRAVRPEDAGSTRPVHALVEIDGSRFETGDPLDLAYAAKPGNTNEKYLVLLRDGNAPAAGLLIEMLAPTRLKRAVLVDQALEPLEELPIREGEVKLLSVFPRFLRGDVDADGEVTLGDPIALLEYLFTGGGAPPCPDAADGNDDGRLDITDAVVVLRHIFGAGVEPPAPGPRTCGEDPTEDKLSGCSYPTYRCP